MNYAGIKMYDVANGPGVRLSLFVSGCRNNCPGCFNQEAQDFNYGLTFTQQVIDEIVNGLQTPEIQGLTVLGGEPLEPENQHLLLRLLQNCHLKCPDKNIWLYTGLVYEDLISHTSRVETEWLQWILECVDVLVDGPFIESKKNLALAFRGSTNQRLINLKAMRKAHDMETVRTLDLDRK